MVDEVPLFYCNQMHPNYALDERAIKQIIRRNVVLCQPDKHRLKILIYYRNLKTNNLVSRNNLSFKPSVLQQTHLVYQFQCPLPHSTVETYIGHTRTSLARRLTMHLQDGAIKKHFSISHHFTPPRKLLDDNTSIIFREGNFARLKIREALFIKKCAPSINRQFDTFPSTLKLFDSSTTATSSSACFDQNRLFVAGEPETVGRGGRCADISGGLPVSRLPEGGPVVLEVLEEERIDEPMALHASGDVADVHDSFHHLVDNINITLRKK